MKTLVTDLYRLRFNKDLETRNRIWKILCHDFFQKYVKGNDVVCDIGAGYCEFINNINCGRKIAIDLNSETRDYAKKGVETLICSSTSIPDKLKEEVDVAFASNFFEHLATKEDLAKTLVEIKKILKKGGKFIILMPNIRYVGAAYWDFLDHQLPLTDRTMVEALELNGFEIIEKRIKFLPYTTKSRLPKAQILVKIYLAVSPLQFLFGKQSLLVARKN